MDLVRGEVVLFLDADDVLEPFAAERVARAFADEPGLARVHYRLRVMDASGRDTGEIKPPLRLGLARGDLTRATLRTPFDAAWLPTSGNAFSAAALRRILPIPEDDYRLCADWYLVHVSSLVGPVAAIDAPLARYRVHGANGFTRGELASTSPISPTPSATRRSRAATCSGTRASPASTTTSAGPRRCATSPTGRCCSGSRPGAPPTRFPSGPRCGSERGPAPDGGTSASAMKVVFLLWLAAMLAAPRAVARWLGELFLLPERRPAINPLLGALHRS